jgi:hypothetical protein
MTIELSPSYFLRKWNNDYVHYIFQQGNLTNIMMEKHDNEEG